VAYLKMAFQHRNTKKKNRYSKQNSYSNSIITHNTEFQSKTCKMVHAIYGKLHLWPHFVTGQYGYKLKQLTNVMHKSPTLNFINMAYDGHEKVQGLT
jgi:spore coat polysaccharide biosynthesis predicted glycosyltransferase SpsG